MTVGASFHGSPVEFAPELAQLLANRERVFEADTGVVGVADPDLFHEIVSARPVLPGERSVFKPVRRVPVEDELANAVIRALGHDVTRALAAPVPDLRGHWPERGRRVLHGLLFASDRAPLSLMRKDFITESKLLSAAADSTWSTLSSRLLTSRAHTALAGLLGTARDATERRRLLALYRRTTSVFVDGLAGLVANAAWLLPDDPDPAQVRAYLWETLRLLPPAWMLWRDPDPRFAALHPAIGPTDAIALLPLLLHRDPGLWDSPAAFRPERWTGVDPVRVPGFVPFGLAGARCWARHLILPLAERLLAEVVEQGLRPARPGTPARVPLRPLLSVRIELVGRP